MKDLIKTSWLDLWITGDCDPLEEHDPLLVLWSTVPASSSDGTGTRVQAQPRINKYIFYVIIVGFYFLCMYSICISKKQTPICVLTLQGSRLSKLSKKGGHKEHSILHHPSKIIIFIIV